MFDYAHYGNTVFRPRVRWSNTPRTNLIIFNAEEDVDELVKKLRIGNKVSEAYTSELTSMIMKYWDCLFLKCARRTILDYEFSIDTGAFTQYTVVVHHMAPHEKPIIMEQISSLFCNDWIEECGGA